MTPLRRTNARIGPARRRGWIGISAIAFQALLAGATIARGDTITNVDLSSYFCNCSDNSWSTMAFSGNAIQTALESGSGNAGSGLTFSDPSGQFVGIGNLDASFTTSVTIGALSVALTSNSVVHALINNFYGTTGTDAVVTFTNSNGQTAIFNLIGGQTIRDYNDNNFVNTISGSNSDPAANGDVTAQLWWSTQDGSSNLDGQPSQRLDAQTFVLPSSWDGSDLVSVEIDNPNPGSMTGETGDIILSALQVETPVGVPEPSSFSLFAVGAFGLAALCRRRETRRRITTGSR